MGRLVDDDGFLLVVPFPLVAAAPAVPTFLQPNPPACADFPQMQLEMPPWSMPVARSAAHWELNCAIVLSVVRSYCSTRIGAHGLGMLSRG